MILGGTKKLRYYKRKKKRNKKRRMNKKRTRRETLKIRNVNREKNVE